MLCVIAKCSPEADEKLNALRASVFPRDCFVSPLNAHITVAAYLPEDDRAFMESCEKLISGTRPFSVQYRKLEVFPETSVIVAAFCSSCPSGQIRPCSSLPSAWLINIIPFFRITGKSAGFLIPPRLYVLSLIWSLLHIFP